MLPGLLACAVVALAARFLELRLDLGLGTALALAIGLAVGSVARVRAVLLAGSALAARSALRVGIVLLGARLTVQQVVETGASSVLAIVAVVTVALVLGTWLAGRLRVASPLSVLITVGMAICGNSAILALSPILRAPHRETAYAVSTITLFGLVGVLSLPLLGGALGLSDEAFGIWAGLAVNDTAQVVATGYTYAPESGDVATVVKLTRNLAILPVLLGATWLAVRSATTESSALSAASTWRLVARAIPWFVVGFVVFAGLRSAGLLDAIVAPGTSLASLLADVGALLILVALAGVGISTDVRATLGVGSRPFLLGAVMWLVIGLLGLALATVAAGPPPSVGLMALYHAG